MRRKFDWANVLERVFWTFVQGALAIPVLDAFNVNGLDDVNMWTAALAGGVAAVLSLLKNLAAEATQGTPAVPASAAEDLVRDVDTYDRNDVL